MSCDVTNSPFARLRGPCWGSLQRSFKQRDAKMTSHKCWSSSVMKIIVTLGLN